MAAPNLPVSARAAVFIAVGKPLTLASFALPQLRGSEALIKISCATICGSDLHSYSGSRHSPIPCILGHEMVGRIAATGPEGTWDFHGQRLALGDRVTWSMVWSCGNCFYCQLGLRSKCDRLMKFGHEELTERRVFSGGMAEYCHLPEGTAIFRVPDHVPDTVASPANCATATVAATLRSAGSLQGKTVIIHGAGMLGLTACAMAKVSGATEIFILDPHPLRREQSLNFGASSSINSSLPREAIHSTIRDRTAGRGADVAIELSGDPEAIEQGLELLRFGGRLVLAGSTFPSRPVQFPAEQAVRRLLQIVGVYNYNPEDLDTALQFLSDYCQEFPFERLVGRQYSLDDINAAFELPKDQRPPRVAVIP